jgi:hypothetical protein
MQVTMQVTVLNTVLNAVLPFEPGFDTEMINTFILLYKEKYNG